MKRHDLYHCNTGRMLAQFSVAKSNTYVLNTDSNVNGNRLAVQLSDCTIKVFDDPHEKELSTFVHDKEVTKIKFSRKDPTLLFSSSLDGKLNVWDTRSKKVAQTFLDNSDEKLKPLTCLDFNVEEKHLCAGTELIREDAFLLFWDRRSSKVLGGYWDSHTGEITQVHFHPEKSNILGSGAADGLINVYDLNESSENDALIHTINVGSGIATFSWRPDDLISCTSSFEDYQLWSLSEGCPENSKSRNEMIQEYKYLVVDYMIDTLFIDDVWYLATGIYLGTVYLWFAEKKYLSIQFILEGGHSDVVRTISYNSQKKVIITGGEDGSVCKWKLPPKYVAVETKLVKRSFFPESSYNFTIIDRTVNM